MGAISSKTPAATVLSGFRALLEGVEDPIVAAFRDEIGWEMKAREIPASSLPCLKHLSRAAEIAEGQGAPLTLLLADAGSSLAWGQTYNAADFGAHFLENYGWTEIFGTRGHFVNERVAGGFLLLGPHVTYPDHHHVAEEVYLPLTGGAEWRMGNGVFRRRAAGDVIHHASNVSHAMRTGDDPLLALYLWRGGPLAQRSVIGTSPAREEG